MTLSDANSLSIKLSPGDTVITQERISRDVQCRGKPDKSRGFIREKQFHYTAPYMETTVMSGFASINMVVYPIVTSTTVMENINGVTFHLLIYWR
jgi:hypothetical protein